MTAAVEKCSRGHEGISRVQRRTASKDEDQYNDNHAGDDPYPLHLACRVGDLDRVRYLVQVLHHSVDQPDDFDATPLYLAALCGHADICEFLLRRGARCGGGDGGAGGEAARVFYVALTPELRNLLKAWSLSASAVSTQDPFLEAFRALSRNHDHSDCVWNLGDGAVDERGGGLGSGGPDLYLHKVLLNQLCPRLLDHVRDVDSATGQNQDRVVVALPCRLNGPDNTSHLRWEDGAVAASLLVEYLYTGACDLRGDGDQARMLADLATHLELGALARDIRQSLDEHHDTGPLGKADGRRQGRKNSGALSCSFHHDVKAKMASLADLVTSQHRRAVPFSDLTLTWNPAQGRGGRNRTWRVHVAILAAHSEYFSCAVRGGFQEAETSVVDMTHLALSDLVVDLALQWMYCGSFLALKAREDESSESSSAVTIDLAVSVVELASAILCPRLGHYAAQAVLIPALEEPGVVFGALELARAHGLDRLEDRCAQVIAQNLPELVTSDELQRVLRDEIRQTTQRGDVRVVDVPLAAEIRRHLRNLSSSATETKKAGTTATIDREVHSDASAGTCNKVDMNALLELLDDALARAVVAEEMHKEHGHRSIGLTNH